MYSRNAEGYTALYQAARRQLPVQLFFQLGEREGQLFGLQMPQLLAETPDFDDSEERQLWKFAVSAATGWEEDEIHVAVA
jgi:hypothetical protein